MTFWTYPPYDVRLNFYRKRQEGVCCELTRLTENIYV